ncbi:MAG: flippase-like domain-containing protein [Candidatus Bathyarchaeota archaeon]|nr:flippase-like domain-containing protein [Candidatus Bathyarchaeota archaeon]
MDKEKNPRKINPMWLVMAAGLIALILYVFFYVDPAQVADILSQTNLAIYSCAFVTYTLYTLCSALVWRGLLGGLAVKISRRKAFLFTWVGLFFEATVPQLGWSAEISKTYLYSKDSKVEAGSVGASVVGQKIFTMTLTISALTAGLALLLLRYSLPLSTALLIGVVLFLSILALAVVYYISLKPKATKTLLGWAVKVIRLFRKNWNPQGFTDKAEGLLGQFHTGMVQLRTNPRALVAPIVLSVLGFVFEVSVMFLAFAALGQPVQADVVLIVFALTGTLQTVGATFVGFPELIMTVTLQALSIAPSVALSVTLLTRVVTLWFRLGVSYGALQWAGIKILKQNKDA